MTAMRLTKPTLPLTATLALPLALAGCNGAFLGNFFVLGVAVAIFFGTLSLGRKSAPTSADSSAADASRSTRPIQDA